MGPGDFTHPEWRKELEEKLVPAEDGFYCLKEDSVLEESREYEGEAPRFVLSGEISSIYKKNEKVSCKSFNTIDDFYDFKYPSDHLPILAKFLIQ